MRSYPSVYNLGHRAAADVLVGAVTVQEKIDGSQFSFGEFENNSAEDDGANGPIYRLEMRSKGADVFPGATDKLFLAAVDTVMRLRNAGLLRRGWTYRGEVLAKPKHNTLAYARVPRGNIILFDADRGDEDYLAPAELAAEAARLGLECVPTLMVEAVASLDQLKALLQTASVLGGVALEGVVIKAYGRFGVDKKTLMAKYVSEAFKEVHGKDWRGRNPATVEIVQRLADKYRTTARWQKAVQHLREAGALQEAVQDIGPLMRAVAQDVRSEERDAIEAALFEYAWPKIARGVTAGLPQWYKDELAKAAFAPRDGVV